MVLIIHQEERIERIEVEGKILHPEMYGFKISDKIQSIAGLYPESLISWCDITYVPYLNVSAFAKAIESNRHLVSYAADGAFIIPEEIGFVEQSIFLNVDKKVKFPSIRMSADVGGAHAVLIKGLSNSFFKGESFEGALWAVAKEGINQGLFCFSVPDLLSRKRDDHDKKSVQDVGELYGFVRQHYKSVWLYLLFFNEIIYQKKFHFASFFKALITSRQKFLINLPPLKWSSPQISPNPTMDVIIPTIGRKAYLYDVLRDLAKQEDFIKKVIVVEQNENPDSTTELDFLGETWPFKIQHIFIHKTGACNARNIALKHVESEWVFLADDDIRIESSFTKKIKQLIKASNAKAFTLSCLKKGEVEQKKDILQWSAFGSGCSIVHSKFLSGLEFDIAYEHGFGEDADFGMLLRQKGADIVYVPYIKLLHRKAPIGGFRKRHVHPWEKYEIQPKPSPTVMYFQRKHLSDLQLKGYKTLLFIKFYKNQKVKNPIQYLKIMQQKWESSKQWSQNLK